MTELGDPGDLDVLLRALDLLADQLGVPVRNVSPEANGRPRRREAGVDGAWNDVSHASRRS
jgi:hypothetical protein